LTQHTTITWVQIFASALLSLSSKSVYFIQVVLLLESEEHVSPDWLLHGNRRAAVSCIRRLYHEAREVTQNVRFSSFMFTIPPGATASFRTAVVALRWCLRFEFLVSEASAGVGSRKVKAEELIWRMPLAVVPA
jgi:hypothetical protein